MKKYLALLLIIFALCSCDRNEQKIISLSNEKIPLWQHDSLKESIFEFENIQSKQFTISFWYKANQNKPGDTILEFSGVRLLSSGYNGKDYSGLTLTDSVNWIVANGIYIRAHSSFSILFC